jgi:hypothetical protein
MVDGTAKTRRDKTEWPRDAEGHLVFSGRRLDLDSQFREGAEDG